MFFGPGLTSCDLSISKAISLGERRQLRLEASFFNPFQQRQSKQSGHERPGQKRWRHSQRRPGSARDAARVGIHLLIAICGRLGEAFKPRSGHLLSGDVAADTKPSKGHLWARARGTSRGRQRNGQTTLRGISESLESAGILDSSVIFNFAKAKL